jgi:hypothetical protein
MRPDHHILRVVVNPLPAPVEQAWRAYDRLQHRLTDLQRHAPGIEPAEEELARDTLKAALSDDETVCWVSAVDVLAAHQNLEAHKATVAATHRALSAAETHISHAIVACERQLCEALDDRLMNLQHEPGLRKAAHAVPLGVSSDGLLAAGQDMAKQAALLGEAAGRFEAFRAARRVIFEYVKPARDTPWLATVAEGMEDGLTWKSEFVHLASGREPEPWTGGPGGELHYAVLKTIRLRVWTAEQLDQAGYTPAGMIVMQPARM